MLKIKPMKLLTKSLFILFTILLLSCKKEGKKDYAYTVISKDSCSIMYRDDNNMLKDTTIIGEWNYSGVLYETKHLFIKLGDTVNINTILLLTINNKFIKPDTVDGMKIIDIIYVHPH